MNETFSSGRGRKLISRASAEELGSVSGYMLDTSRRMISALIVGQGRRNGTLVNWENVVGFGPDAVMVNDNSAVRSADDERERLACDGKLDLLGRRALTTTGDELGKVEDVVFSTDDGLIVTILVAGREIPGESMLGLGSYAVVLSVDASS